MTEGCLYQGDNLQILRRHVPDASVNLVYLDPPFNSNRVYSKPPRRSGGPKILGFDDTWRWDRAASDAFDELCDRGDNAKLTLILAAFRNALGAGDLLAYLTMMSTRLVELARVLKPSGSLYLHCDPTASHYLKVLLDVVMGPGTFQNEVIWRYRRWPTRANRFQRMHDVLLFYSKSDRGEHSFQTLYGYESLAPSTLKTFGTKKQLADFSSGHRKPSTLNEETLGPPLSDVWEVGVIAAIGKERTGWPTQKPEALLERVVRASSREGDIVLDPFCGSGTSLVVAHKLGRRFLGIDAAPLAIETARKRLENAGADARVVHKDPAVANVA
ncbi:MAG: site-specific DNA-methyltransferase [Polyangiaceae bacterium]|nr:site-specific DNA-methyltransferase [Polyangiaceae bacterium]